jgi:hypothetical protein
MPKTSRLYCEVDLQHEISKKMPCMRDSQPRYDAAFLVSTYTQKHPKTNGNPSSIHTPQAIFFTCTSPYSLPTKNYQISVQDEHGFHTKLVPLP